MKSYLSLVSVLVFSMNAFAAKVSPIALSEAKSAPLAFIGMDALQIQATAQGKEDLKTEAFSIQKDRGQSEMKFVRQFLHIHQNCKDEASVSATLLNGTDMSGVAKAFVAYNPENTNYLAKVEEYRKDLAQSQQSAKNLRVYEVEYSGGGSCEFGINGHLILDKKTDEAVLVFSQWSA